nr:immunoglobulin light chain junction region [Macaca mulatta]
CMQRLEFPMSSF